MKNIRRLIVIMLAIMVLFVSAVPAMAATKTVALTGISLNKTSGTINKGNSTTLTVTFKPANTTASKVVVWTTSNSSVAQVSKGKVTGIAPGTATITAKCGTKTATFKVTVKSPITKLTLGTTSKTINVGDNFGISVSYAPANTTDSKTITWTTSNNKVATVSGGRVVGVGAGTATITAKMGSKTATCKVTVKKVAPKYIATTDCYTYLNNYRTKAGLKKLTKDANLEKIAKERAAQIVKNFEHYVPKGTKTAKKTFTAKTAALTYVKTRLGELGRKTNIYLGENIAKGQTSCKEVTTAWYNSTGHRANMLNKNYTKVGIAGYQVDGVIYWVQIFSSNN